VNRNELEKTKPANETLKADKTVPRHWLSGGSYAKRVGAAWTVDWAQDRRRCPRKATRLAQERKPIRRSTCRTALRSEDPPRHWLSGANYGSRPQPAYPPADPGG